MTHTKYSSENEIPSSICVEIWELQVNLDDNGSINISPVKNKPAHKYLVVVNIFAGYFHDVSDLFKKRQLCMSNVIGDWHRWGFIPNYFGFFALSSILGHSLSVLFWGIIQHKF